MRQNLHVILLSDEVGSKFRDICRRYPSLINRSTIDWYNEWDAGAMLSVAKAYFHDNRFLSHSSSDKPETGAVAVCIPHVHFTLLRMSHSLIRCVTHTYVIRESTAALIIMSACNNSMDILMY